MNTKCTCSNPSLHAELVGNRPINPNLCRRAPSQASTLDQLNELVNLANKNGLYDAAEWLDNAMSSLKIRG